MQGLWECHRMWEGVQSFSSVDSMLVKPSLMTAFTLKSLDIHSKRTDRDFLPSRVCHLVAINAKTLLLTNFTMLLLCNARPAS